MKDFIQISESEYINVAEIQRIQISGKSSISEGTVNIQLKDKVVVETKKTPEEFKALLEAAR